MKFAATTMLLGCAAAGVAALQFKSVENRLSTIPVVPDIQQALSRIAQPFSPMWGHSHLAGQATADFLPKAPPNIAFPKVEMPREELMELIHAAALRHNVPSAFVKSIVAAESNFDPNVVSPKGAIGQMQLMPATAEEYGADPTVPAENIDAGTHYLRVLMDRYHHGRSSLKRVIAAYNAGPAMVDRYRGIPPFPETRLYVARVLSFLRQFERRA
jgi:soluble lytic murein transglycosylase-like protein